MEREVKSLEELKEIAGEFLATLKEGEAGRGATVVGLSGDLGAGKTAFTKCVADLLGIQETVTSPTFILEKIYTIPGKSLLGDRFTKLVHIDAYRLEHGDEMRPLYWDALLADPKNLIFLEWPEQVESALPSAMIRLSFAYVSESVRRIAFDQHGKN